MPCWTAGSIGGPFFWCLWSLAAQTIFPPGKGFFISCFGSFTLYWEGELVRIPSRKAREVLALLFTERGRPLRKVHAAERLWPGVDQAHAMDCLYKACGVLRRLIRQGVPLPLVWERDTLLLDGTHIDSDVDRFERLYLRREDAACREAAIAIYTAPFLLNEYYEWTAGLEAYYDMRYLELLHLAEESANTPYAASYYRGLLYEAR